ncbi:hypothetical protein P9314_04185, partial [Paenibacillus validus]|uniref:hypothetical protein n=1 Tax=Paenibacillus validus TaxID=44253 RepID=UPI002E222114|nr:hypothetical protein [Paenibacillus validus]
LSRAERQVARIARAGESFRNWPVWGVESGCWGGFIDLPPICDAPYWRKIERFHARFRRLFNVFASFDTFVQVDELQKEPPKPNSIRRRLLACVYNNAYY